jgi:NADPH:quinone reductase-like Zn-dependent oxidoreductase
MKAVVVPVYGGAEVLQYQDMPIPAVQANEILVQVYNAGVSPFDLHVRDGWYKESANYSLPIILGWELSGVVAIVGKNVSRFKVGDAVFAHPSVYRQGGAYAEYVAIPENEVAHKPASVNHAQAAAVSMNALTAWQALFDTAQLKSEQKILIHAAAGGVGHLAVQLAKWKGAKVIGTASAKNRSFLFDLGVDEVIDYNAQAFENVIKEVDVVLDTLGGDTLMKSFAVTKRNGIIVSIIDFERIKQAAAFGVRGENVIVSPNAEQLTQIAALLEAGIIKPHIEAIFPLTEAKKAHELLQSGHVRGKIVLNNIR